MIKEAETPKKTTTAPRKNAVVTAAQGDGRVQSAEGKIPERENDKIGSVLFHERMKKGLDIAEISQVLCIRCTYLEAIEKGSYEELPPMPYSAGFVNSYAKYLGLNNARITQLFREEINADAQKVNPIVNVEVPAEASVPNKLYVMIGIGAVALLTLLWGIFSPSSEDKAQEEKTETVVVEEVTDSSAQEVEYFESYKVEVAEKVADGKTESVVEVPSQVVISEESYIEPSAKKTTKAEENVKAENGIEVKITKEDTWLEVKDAKRVYLNKVLHVGESYRFPKVKGLIFSAGKFDGVEVYVNGILTPLVKQNRKMNIDIDAVLNANH